MITFKCGRVYWVGLAVLFIACGTVPGARQEFEAAQEVRAVADLMAQTPHRVTVAELEAMLMAQTEQQVARGKGTALRSPYWRISVIRETEETRSPVAEITLYPETPLRLTLQDLASLGTWKLIRQSKSSTVRFDYARHGGRAVIYVELKFPPKDPQSPVVWVRLRPESDIP